MFAFGRKEKKMTSQILIKVFETFLGATSPRDNFFANIENKGKKSVYSEQQWKNE